MTIPARIAVPAFLGTPDSRLIDRGSPPENLEAPTDALLAQPITPNALHFVRNHALSSPCIDAATYRLSVSGAVERATEFSLEALKSFEPVTLEALMQCAGNGRAFFKTETPGNQWERGAVAVARWRGLRLADVLEWAGIQPEGGFLVFDGSDPAVETGVDYRKCVPLARALECLLAYEVNGEPLSVAHGFPLRLIVPGWSATYWVKWLRSIVVQTEPCQSFFMANTYRMPLGAQTPGKPLDLEHSEPITENNVKSLIAYPTPATRPVAHAQRCAVLPGAAARAQLPAWTSPPTAAAPGPPLTLKRARNPLPGAPGSTTGYRDPQGSTPSRRGPPTARATSNP